MFSFILLVKWLIILAQSKRLYLVTKLAIGVLECGNSKYRNWPVAISVAELSHFSG